MNTKRTLPEGYRELEVGEVIQLGDRFRQKNSGEGFGEYFSNIGHTYKGGEEAWNRGFKSDWINDPEYIGFTKRPKAFPRYFGEAKNPHWFIQINGNDAFKNFHWNSGKILSYNWTLEECLAAIEEKGNIIWGEYSAEEVAAIKAKFETKQEVKSESISMKNNVQVGDVLIGEYYQFIIAVPDADSRAMLICLNNSKGRRWSSQRATIKNDNITLDELVLITQRDSRTLLRSWYVKDEASDVPLSKIYPAPFMIGKYEVVKEGTGIKVGCTPVSKEQLVKACELAGLKVS